MGLFDVGLSPITSIIGEDAMSKIPVLGSLAGAKSDEYKALIKKQEEMARAMEARRKEQHAQNLNSLSQSMVAFGPRNQMMAQMFGPEAAFTPQQMAAMAQDPAGPPQPGMVKEGGGGGGISDGFAALRGESRGNDGMVSLAGYTGTDPKVQAEVEKYLQELKAYNEREERRRQFVESNVQPVGPGPAPIKMPRPQAGRR